MVISNTFDLWGTPVLVSLFLTLIQAGVNGEDNPSFKNACETIYQKQ